MVQLLLLVLLCLLPQSAYAGDDYTLYISTTGLTYHGYPINQDVAGEMPHRLTKNGKVVWHPQEFSVNLMLKSSLHLSFTTLQDCFDEPAQMYGIGNHWHPTERLGVGYLAALYTRNRHYFIDSDGDLAYPSDMPYTIKKGDRDYIPTALITTSYQLMRDGNLRLALLFAGNVWINHFELGVGFSW